MRKESIMAKILAIGEIINGKMRKSSKEVVSVAKKLSGSASAVLIGENATGFAKELAAFGADTIYAGDLKDFSGQAYAEAVASIVKSKGYDVVLIPHGNTGREISARLGALLDTGVVSDVVELAMEGDSVVCKRPVYSGKAYVKMKVVGTPQIITIRGNTQGISESAGAGNVESISVNASGDKAKQTNYVAQISSRIPAAEADIVVSGGRGLKSKENFVLVEELADILGAGVGASRAPVDAEWVEPNMQIGQTGQTVSPNVYIALGISGAIQHLAGMGSSKFIISVNKDPDAPIFKVSSLGVVDDLFKVVPTMKDELKTLLGK